MFYTYTCFCFQRRVEGLGKVPLHTRGKTQVLQPCLLPLLFQQPKREMVLEAVAIPPQSRVVIFCFFVG